MSFTHIIKSSEPVFNVLVQALFLGQKFPAAVYISLIPIVLGCSMAAVSELSFNAAGFWGAMISNLAFVIRGILSKEKLKVGTSSWPRSREQPSKPDLAHVFEELWVMNSTPFSESMCSSAPRKWAQL